MGLVLAATSGESSLWDWLLNVLWMVLGVGGGLGFVIFVHELGHFLVAKACGVKCEKFYIGFDFFEIKIGPLKIPRALYKFQWGETEYGIGILPLGGYVKMLGQDDDPRNAEAEAERTKVLAEGTAAEGLVEGTTVEGKKVFLDPRSYPAKSVPARMAIISAGVIMNLIFGVIFAAGAYKLGVREIPAVLGSTVPGGPAWQENIPPGSKIIQLGESGKPHEFVRWEDLRREVMFAGYKDDLYMKVRTPDGKVVDYNIRPSDRLKELVGQPTLGVTQLQSREIAVHPADHPGAHLNPVATPALQDRDSIVAINGQKVVADHEVPAMLARNSDKPLRLTVERQGKQDDGKVVDPLAPKKQLDVTVAPRPMRDLGVVMRIGPVVAVRDDSPAAEAGFRVGDVVEKVNDQPVGDPLTLGQRLAPATEPGEPITFTVARKNGEEKAASRQLTVTPHLPEQFNVLGTMGPLAIESIGLAYDVTNIVAEIDPGSPAEKAGLQAGDVITVAASVHADDAKREREKELLTKTGIDPIEIDNKLNTWTLVMIRMQNILPDTRVKLTWHRDGKPMSAELLPRDSETLFDESHGINRYGATRKHTAANWAEAFQLGFRETTERLKEVGAVLSRLVTGRISPTNLSGIPGIVYVATIFADEGLAKLLLFLTMLSANLALLNFLPIPALDGGHMLFLAAEAIRGKPVDERLQIRLTVVGVICLLSLMVFATAMDIGRFATWLLN